MSKKGQRITLQPQKGEQGQMTAKRSPLLTNIFLESLVEIISLNFNLKMDEEFDTQKEEQESEPTEPLEEELDEIEKKESDESEDSENSE